MISTSFVHAELLKCLAGLAPAPSLVEGAAGAMASITVQQRVRVDQAEAAWQLLQLSLTPGAYLQEK